MVTRTQRSTPSLEIQQVGQIPYRVALENEIMVIGRDPDCDVPLPSDYVSWRHARIERSGARVWLYHAQTRNGLLVNGKALEGAIELHDGDELCVADLRLIFHAGSGPGETKTFTGTPPTVTAATARIASATGSSRPGTAVAGLAIDARGRRLLFRGQPVPVMLSAQEFVLLELLCERPGEVRWYGEIGTRIWGADEYDVNHVHALVARVKRKLAAVGLAGHIVAVPRVGYRLDPA